ncbi:MAG: hypothetical protein LAT67_04505 [Balneolales bacterium]|nr:hypothetical protein [Balneolales bacterium]
MTVKTRTAPIFVVACAILLPVMLSGCSGSLRSSWINFNSYFNTFYNAEQSYKRGFKAFENQVDRINAERPIRIHRSPVRAGSNDFEDAIARGSDLLVRFPESRHVDNTLLLIGKSFFFLQNYYNAEQKFNELYSITESNTLRQQAVIWRARTMLEQERYSDGINYLVSQFDSPEISWGRRELAEAELIYAQHLVKTNQWEESGRVLFAALPNVRDNELRARGYFLHGQILEYLGDYEASFEAYNRVRRSNPYYQMIYFSELKKGILLRKMERYEESRRHFVSMARDNNNFEFLPEINMNLAKTFSAMGEVDASKERFREVLYFSHRTPQREVLAQTHFGLAELYRFRINDINLAAAHYDTAARNTSDLEMLPRGFKARETSRAFSEFARLHNDHERMDSLLTLGSLPPAQFDSVITRIQEDYRRQMRAAERERRRQSSRIVTVEPGDMDSATESGENGFLFHLNRQLMSQASLQFQALWDGRPLVDNWRRQDAVRQAIILAEEGGEEAEKLDIVFVEEIEFDEYELDLSAIPRTRAAREQMRDDLVRTKYEIGNLYFLSLSEPDNAKNYFQSILNRFQNSSMEALVMYSLSEVFYSDGNEEEAHQWALQIADKYPATPYARRLSERFDLGIVAEETPVSEEERVALEYTRLLSAIDEMPEEEAAHALFHFGVADTISSKAPEALMNAARKFIQMEVSSDSFQQRLGLYRDKEQHYLTEKQNLSVLQDSARVVLADTALAETDPELFLYWTEITEKEIQEPDLRSVFPYTGERWDFAREALATIESRFPNFRQMPRVRVLKEEIAKLPEPEPEPEPELEPEPESEQPGDETETEKEEEVVLTDGHAVAWKLEPDDTTVYNADDIRVEPRVATEGGLQAFIDKSGVIEQMQRINVMQATFSFRVHVDTEGEITRVVPVDQDDEFGLLETIMEQMQLLLSFEPAIFNEKRVPVIYNLDLPVSVPRE